MMRNWIVSWVLASSVCAALGSLDALAVTKNWNSSSGGNWSDATKWTPSGAPGVADDARVTLDGTYTIALDANAQVASLTLGGAAGTQTLFIASTALTLEGASTINTNGTLSQTGGTVNGAGLLTVDGTYAFSGGTLSGSGVTTVNGTLTFGGNSLKTINGRTLNTTGSTTWTMTTWSIQVGNGAVINNSGTWDCQTNRSMTSLGGAAAFVNSGIFKKSGGTGQTIVSIPFDNTGSVLAQTGTINLSGGGAHTGSFSGSGGTVQFGGGTHALNIGTTLAGSVQLASGTLDINSGISAGTLSQSGGTLNVNSALSAQSFSQAGGTLQGAATFTTTGLYNWTNGSMAGTGTTTTNGGLAIGGSSLKTINGRTLNTTGSTTWTMTTWSIQVGNGAVINNSGTWDCQTDRSMTSLGGTAAFVNSGIFKKSGGTGQTIVGIAFTNSGSVEVQTGTLNLSGSNFIQTAGITKLMGGALSSSTNINIQGGALAGSGTITGPVIVTGTGSLAPGLSPGTLGIVGNYSQQGSSAAFNVEIGGRTPGSQFDRADVSGAGHVAAVAGVLKVSLINSFAPVPGDTFTIMTYPSHTGTFTPDLTRAGCFDWSVDYGATSVVLSAVGVRDGACDDGNACTTNDTCVGEVCTGTSLPTQMFYRDQDGDGYGDPVNTVQSCSTPMGYVAVGGDCHDSNAAINPAANELPGNNFDENCDGRLTQPLNSIHGIIQFADGSPVPASLLIVNAKESSGLYSGCHPGPDASGSTRFWCDVAPGCYTIETTYAPQPPPQSPLTGDPYFLGTRRSTALPFCIDGNMVENVYVVYPQPVVLVHGFGCETKATGTTGIWSQAAGLTTAGIPVFIVNTQNQPQGSTGLYGCGDYTSNMSYLERYLDEIVVPNVSTVGRPLPKINFLAHSMGGLIVRRFLHSTPPLGGTHYESSRVSRVVELGTPNAGTVAAGAGFTAILDNARKLLSRGVVEKFNRQYGERRGVDYFYIAGENNAGLRNDCGQLHPVWEPNPEDGLVAEQSVFRRQVLTNRFWNDRWFDSTNHRNPIDGSHICEPQAGHCELLSFLDTQTTVGSEVIGVLKGSTSPGYIDPECNLETTAFTSTDPSDVLQSEPSREMIGSEQFLLADGATSTAPFHVDAMNELLISGIVETGNARLEIGRPDGQAITPDNWSLFPSVTFEELALGAAGMIYRYTIVVPETGVWTASLTAQLDGAVTPTRAGLEALALTTRRLESQELVYDARSGQPITISVGYSDGDDPLLGASVAADLTTPPGGITTYSLQDDGIAPDEVADDGIYAATMDAMSEVGTHDIRIRAVADVIGQTVQREAAAALDIASGGAGFGAAVSDDGMDSDGDSLFEGVDVTVEVDASIPGTYEVRAKLEDLSGGLISQEGATVTAEQPGVVAVHLQFRSAAIVAHGTNGPFNVSDAFVLSGADGHLVEDYRSLLHPTSQYLLTSFEAPDSDGDGWEDSLDDCPEAYDALQIDTDIDGLGDACDPDIDGDGVSNTQDPAPYDPTATDTPSAVDISLSDSTTILWADAASPGSGTVHDVVRGDLKDLWNNGCFTGAACLVAGATGTMTTDSTDPPPDGGFFYLVRGRNSIGQGEFSDTGEITVSCP